jgi:hypothetical protein
MQEEGDGDVLRFGHRRRRCLQLASLPFPMAIVAAVPFMSTAFPSPPTVAWIFS